MIARTPVRLLCLILALPGIVAGVASAAPVPPRVTSVVEPFPLERVRLLDGPCLAAQEANRKYLRFLDAERLLHAFRVNAGLPSTAQPLGGWESPDCEVRGHFVGHYLSACALMVASTGDAELRAKANYMVAELAKCQAALGGGYLSAYPASFWDRLESLQNPPWAPYYTIHKIMAGLLDCYTHLGNQQALEVLKGMAGYFSDRFSRLSTWQVDQLLGVEFGGMSEVLHNLYAVTGDPAHLALAHQFDKAAFLGPLALEHDNLSHLHANTHIPEICAAARRYELTGDQRYRTAVQFFWDRVANHRSYATGGSNVAEAWGDADKLAGTLAANNQESCTTYNMLKVTRYLYRWTGDPAYAGFYERAFLNGILGTQDPATGMLIYYLPLATGNTKTFGTPYDSFWCCTATGVESFSKLGDSIYFHNDGGRSGSPQADGLYVNLFVASSADWAEKGVRLEQRTRFPREEGTTLTVHASRPTEFALHIRVPSWATRGVEARVNGSVERRITPASTTGATGESYLVLRRTWRDGDRVRVALPMSLHAEPMPDDPELAAIMYGPLVLAGLTDHGRHFVADAANVSAWVKPVPGKPLTFCAAGQPSDLTFTPLNRIIGERYGVYFPIVKEGSPRHRALLAAEEARRQREARVLDRVLANDDASERAHNLQGWKMGAGPYGGRGWRHAVDGWFSWDLKVLPDADMTLVCTYWGDDVPPRTFDILVGGKVIATQALNRDLPGEFFDVEYKVPRELTQGKTAVTVRFEAHKGNTAGGVFECATLRPQP